MEWLGRVLKGVGVVVFVATGLWAFLLELQIISHAFGFLGVLVALFVAPVTFGLVPWYAGFVQHNWLLLQLGYGGMIVTWALHAAGTALSASHKR